MARRPQQRNRNFNTEKTETLKPKGLKLEVRNFPYGIKNHLELAKKKGEPMNMKTDQKTLNLRKKIIRKK